MNFTKRAKRVLSIAQEEAERAGVQYVGTDHLALALAREIEGPHAPFIHVDVPGLRAVSGSAPVIDGEVIEVIEPVVYLPPPDPAV